MAMLEMVVSGIGGCLLQVAQDRFGPLDSKISQKSAPTFPQFQVCCLNQILDQRLRGLSPQGGSAHDRKTDGSPDSGNELLHAS